MKDSITDSILALQRNYVDRTTNGKGQLGLVVPEAFVRGIRHIGYKSNIEALAELVDNSIQAYAERVDLILGYAEGGSLAKPTQLAVVDDGHGMSPEMLRLAIMWGGTHRENDRGGLGRFGYGLPCATVSMGRRFTIYSKLKGECVYAISLDLDLLDSGGYRDGFLGIAIPPAEPATLPSFVVDAIGKQHPKGWESGTVILVEKLDRLEWTTANGLRRNLVRHFGVTYHKLLTAIAIHVDGERVRPIDPLFLDPGSEFHALDADRAQALDSMSLTLDRGDGVFGEINLRYAWLPPSFAATDKSRDAIGMNANPRFPIIKAYHGLIFSRNGRVVDVHSSTPWTTFINNDRYIRVEIEFSAVLDDAFGVTTSKQQVSLSTGMWDQLSVCGLPKAIEQLRAKVRAAKSERQRTAARPVASVGTLLKPVVEAAEAPTTALAFLQNESATQKKLASLLHDAIKASDSPSLLMLLQKIERRASRADPMVIAEYQHLLSDWCRETSRLSQ